MPLMQQMLQCLQVVWASHVAASGYVQISVVLKQVDASLTAEALLSWLFKTRADVGASGGPHCLAPRSVWAGGLPGVHLSRIRASGGTQPLPLQPPAAGLHSICALGPAGAPSPLTPPHLVHAQHTLSDERVFSRKMLSQSSNLENRWPCTRSYF